MTIVNFELVKTSVPKPLLFIKKDKIRRIYNFREFTRGSIRYNEILPSGKSEKIEIECRFALAKNMR
jgi:hypothetical protein